MERFLNDVAAAVLYSLRRCGDALTLELNDNVLC